MPLISLFAHKNRLRRGTMISIALLLSIGLVLPPAIKAEDRELVTRVKPVYPELAKRLKITGAVLLNVVVAPDGTVKSVTTIMGHSALAGAAKEAVLQWKYAKTDYETTEQVEVKFNQ